MDLSKFKEGMIISEQEFNGLLDQIKSTHRFCSSPMDDSQECKKEYSRYASKLTTENVFKRNIMWFTFCKIFNSDQSFTKVKDRIPIHLFVKID